MIMKLYKKLNLMDKKVLFIKIIGFILLIGGLFSLFLVPAEFTAFYAFSEGGNFYYEGFGFGSLMFTFIILNSMIYFAIAFFGIPLGIGNITLKKWGLNLSLATLKTLLIIGTALTISFLFSFELIRTLEIYQTLMILMFFLLFSIILPFFLIQFYKNSKAERLFEDSDTASYFAKQSPEKMTIILLNIFWIFVFYLFIFLNGVFPFLGEFIFRRDGTYLLSIGVFMLLVFTYLIYKNKNYAKYAMLVCYVLLFLTFVFTFFANSTNELLNMLNLPDYEMERVMPAFRIPAGIHLGFFFGILLIIQTYLVLKNKK